MASKSCHRSPCSSSENQELFGRCSRYGSYELLALTALWVVSPVVSPLLALDTDLLKYVGPDAKSVAGIYVDRAVSSPLGLFLQSRRRGESRFP